MALALMLQQMARAPVLCSAPAPARVLAPTALVPVLDVGHLCSAPVPALSPVPAPVRIPTALLLLTDAVALYWTPVAAPTSAPVPTADCGRPRVLALEP